MKSTITQFNSFKKHCNKFILELGLTDYTVYYFHEDLDNSNARCIPDTTNRVVTIILCTTLIDAHKPIEQISYHEICHLLLADMDIMARNGVSEWLVRRTNESIVARLCNARFKS